MKTLSDAGISADEICAAIDADAERVKALRFSHFAWDCVGIAKANRRAVCAFLGGQRRIDVEPGAEDLGTRRLQFGGLGKANQEQKEGTSSQERRVSRHKSKCHEVSEIQLCVNDSHFR